MQERTVSCGVFPQGEAEAAERLGLLKGVETKTEVHCYNAIASALLPTSQLWKWKAKGSSAAGCRW